MDDGERGADVREPGADDGEHGADGREQGADGRERGADERTGGRGAKERPLGNPSTRPPVRLVRIFKNLPMNLFWLKIFYLLYTT